MPAVASLIALLAVNATLAHSNGASDSDGALLLWQLVALSVGHAVWMTAALVFARWAIDSPDDASGCAGLGALWFDR